MSIDNNRSVTNREIPLPPGGGSWTFDESKRKWVSNEPVLVEQESEATAAETNATQIEQEQDA